MIARVLCNGAGGSRRDMRTGRGPGEHWRPRRGNRDTTLPRLLAADTTYKHLQ